MKRTIRRMKRNLTMMALMLTMLPAAVNAGDVVTTSPITTIPCTTLIRITIVNKADYEEKVERPHRAPARYTDIVEATFDGETNILGFEFYKPLSGVVITISKDGTPVHSEIRGDVYEGSTCSFPLSEYGAGQYEIEISAEDLDTELYCSFSVE